MLWIQLSEQLAWPPQSSVQSVASSQRRSALAQVASAGLESSQIAVQRSADWQDTDNPSHTSMSHSALQSVLLPHSSERSLQIEFPVAQSRLHGPPPQVIVPVHARVPEHDTAQPQ